MWLTVNPPLLPRLWNTPSTLLHPRDLHPQTMFCCLNLLLCLIPGCHWAGGYISELCLFTVRAFKHGAARGKCHLILGSSFHLTVSWTPFWELGALGVVSAGNHRSSSLCKDGSLEMLYPCFAAWLAPCAAPGPCHSVIPCAQQGRQSSSCLECGQSCRNGTGWSRTAQSLAASACTNSHTRFPPVLLPPNVLAPPRVVPWSSCAPWAQCWEHLLLFLVFWAEEHQNNNFLQSLRVSPRARVREKPNMCVMRCRMCFIQGAGVV